MTSMRERWTAGDLTFGAWAMLPSALCAEVLSRSGVDWVLIDVQHGSMDIETCFEMIRAIDLGSAEPFVRVPSNEAGTIGRVLDAGALGIVIPMIETVDDARRAVAACRYAPQGQRSYGPLRAALRDGADYFNHANDRIAVVTMIETASALDKVEEIAAVEGVDALFVGPSDLSLALGLPPGDNDGIPAFDDALARIVAAARRHNKAAAMFSTDELAPLRVKQGFQMLSVFTDVIGMSQKLSEDLHSVQRAVAGLKKGSSDASSGGGYVRNTAAAKY